MVDDEHLISLMDITPTVLGPAGMSVPDGLDGKSLVPFLEGVTPEGWREDIVFLRNEDIRNEDIYYGDGIRNALKRSANLRQVLLEEGLGAQIRPYFEGTNSSWKEIRCSRLIALRWNRSRLGSPHPH